MIWGVVVGAAVVLAVAGVAKVARPSPATRAVRSAGIDVDDPMVAALGLVELAAGATALVWHTPITALVVGAFYVAFAAFAVRLLSVGGPRVACGCFGQGSAPIGAEHVVVNLLVAAAAFSAFATGRTGPTDVVAVLGATCLLFVFLALVPTLRSADR